MKGKFVFLFFTVVLIFTMTACSGKSQEEQTYDYSEYIREDLIKAELLETFEEYNIRFYDTSYTQEFGDMNLLKPETAIVGFPVYETKDDTYVYRFENEDEIKAYVSAYMVYLMNMDYDVKELSDNVYAINDEYYMGLGMDEGDYILMIMDV